MGRGGKGCASRFRSEVRAQIARNDKGTINWSRMSSFIVFVIGHWSLIIGVWH
jgi:hypothetical protein